jgi:hypothetical protein
MDSTTEALSWRPPSPDPIPYAQLQPGVRYHIVIGDCCAEGELRARFVGWEVAASTDIQSVGGLPVARFEGEIRLGGYVGLAFPAE